MNAKAIKTINIGILPQQKIRERMLAIAKGELKPKPNDPKIWFTSMRSLAEILSDENRALLKTIWECQPESIATLAKATGRAPGNLSRTLKTMAHYGLVEMRPTENSRAVRPIAKATDFHIFAPS
jgi:predicted transcriptional regulator